MGNPNGNPGNKGGGRKGFYEERDKTNAINKLWEKVNKKVQAGEELSDYEKELVLKLLPKTIKTETDITSGDKPIPILYGIQKHNSDQEDSKDEEKD